MYGSSEKAKAAGPGFQLSLIDVLHMALRRKFLIIGMCVATAVLSAAYSLTLPNVYCATAKILPPKQEGAGLSALMGQVGGNLATLAGGAKGGSDTDLYVAILNSRSLAEAVIGRLGLDRVYGGGTRDQLRRSFAGTLDVQAGKDGLITITASDHDPKRAALIANTCVDELARASVRLNLTKAGAEKYFLEKRLEITKKDLRKAEEELKDFCERNKIVQPDAQAGAALGGVASLRAGIASAEVQLAVLRQAQTEESAEVKSLLAGINRMKQDLARMSGRNGSADGVPTLGAVPEVALAYARKMRELQLQEAIFEQLTKQYEVAKLNDSRDSTTIQVLDQAVTPEVKSKPKRAVIVVLATVAAFVTSVFLAFALSFLETMPEEHRRAIEDIKKLAFSFR